MKGVIGISAVLCLGFFGAQAAFAVGTNSRTAKMLPARSMLTMGGIVTMPERKKSPVFTGEDLARPPKQNSPWSPPAADLPTNYVTATALLFKQGLADPRGCEYDEIEVGTGNVWRGDGGVVTTHGWVLPGHNGQRFAVCWNGLVYPVVSVGTNTDLEADVWLQVTNGLTSWRSALPEAVSVQPAAMEGVHGCLLLRLGKADWAKACWLAQERRSVEERNRLMSQFSRTNNFSTTNEIKLPDNDPYLVWAGDWAWSLFDRMICAHERGDEKLALTDARQLAAAQPLIEETCAKRGFKRQPYWDSRHKNELQPYLNFLGQLPELLADLKRRDKEGPRVSNITTGLTNITSQTQRITALIRDLDLVCAHQWGQPGWVNLAEDPIVAALIHEGDAAVEPLLDCLEHDQRLTRSVGFGRDFFRSRTVIPVSSAANVALKSILQASFFNAAQIRAYWNKYKKLKIEDRWYAILNDDNARSRWLEAAANIVQPVNVTHYPGGFSTTSPIPKNTPVTLRGECLRTNKNPSVTELLTRRALEIPTNNIGNYDLGFCCQMAEYLARWDIQATLPVDRTLSERVFAVMNYSQQSLGKYLVQLSLDRVNAGDKAAFNDYAKWIVTTTPEQFADGDLNCLEPMRQYPTNHIIQNVGETLFGQTNSAWGSLPWKSNFGRPAVDSKLVALPAYRLLLCRELKKTNPCGTVTLQRPGYLAYTVTNLHQSGTFGYLLPAPSLATNGSSADVRWCDWIAIALARDQQIAPFDPFAASPTRDAAIQQAIVRLRPFKTP